MKKTFFFLFLVSAVALFAAPIIGGFSVSTSFLPLSVQPYSLYYYPGTAYEGGYGLDGSFSIGAGFSIPIPWMNFSQLPLLKEELPVALGIAKAESSFQNYSRSSVGAEGLMQFMPTTAPSYGVQNPYDPFQSIRGGLNYIAQYEKRFSSLELALAAYNAGPGAVVKYNGIPPYPETQNYVKKVMKYVNEYASSTQYPEIYARLGFFGEYADGTATIGMAYPLPPGYIDLCPEVSLDASGTVRWSWIWRVNAGVVNIAFNHSNTSDTTSDQIEVSSVFGPLTAIVGSYTNGLAASGILDLWGQKVFGSISQSGEVRYGVALNVFKMYVLAWSNGKTYTFGVNGRW